MATKFLEPGSDATFNVVDTSSGGFWSATNQSPASSTTVVHGQHARSISMGKSGNVLCTTPASTVSDSGARISFYYYVTTIPTTQFARILIATTSGGTSVFQLRLTTAGVLQFWDDNVAQRGSDGATLQAGTWYRISIAYTITSGSVNRFEVFVNGVSSISNTNVTIGTTGTNKIQFTNSNNLDSTVYFSDIYIDDSSSLTDTGDVWVTAKRPNANGTTNGFTTQIGSGGSGYGTGHSPQVNERPLSTTNGWSMVGAGGAVTEEYSIENISTGDINFTGKPIIDFMGWVYASSLASETGSIIVAGASSNISLTSTNTMFTKAAGSTTYPAGGTDIGIVTDTSLTTVSLYECGILIAFNASLNITETPTASESQSVQEVDLTQIGSPYTIIQGVRIIGP